MQYNKLSPVQYKRSRGLCRSSGFVAFARECGASSARLYELEEYYLSVVTLTRAKLEDPGVAALTVSVLRSDFLK